MNKRDFLLSITALSLTCSATLFAKNNQEILLNAFHKNGITKCDKFISKNSRLGGNFNVFIDKHINGIDGPSTEISIVTILGTAGETVKFDDSFIQTAKNCVLHSRSTATKKGSCSSNINLKNWTITSSMPKKDYTAYENKFGVRMYTKELSVGEAKICIIEASLRTKEYQKGKEPKRR